jgi:hypothetical protein
MAARNDTSARPAGSADGIFHVLVIAAEEHVGEPVRRELEERAGGRQTEVRVVVPALADTAFQHAAGDVDQGLERARDQLGTSLREVDETGVEAEGRVGDADPVRAIEDALYDFPADEIVIVTHPDREARWLEDDLFERARHRFRPPIVHFVVTEGRLEATERAGPGLDPADEAEIEGDSENLPRFSARDVAGIIWAIVGTLILVAIAAANPDETASGFDLDAMHTLIAGAFGLINLAHVVGLVLFESVGYRGLAQRFFADLSLYGTTAAIGVSLLLLLF